jgi:hypothetical protein
MATEVVTETGCPGARAADAGALAALTGVVGPESALSAHAASNKDKAATMAPREKWVKKNFIFMVKTDYQRPTPSGGTPPGYFA